MMLPKGSSKGPAQAACADTASAPCECRCRGPIHSVVRGLGWFLVAYGILLMTAWHLHWMQLVQLGPARTPIVYNTCLLLALAGAGVLAANTCRFAWSAGLGAALAMASGILGAEYLLGVDLGLDELVVNQGLLPGGEHPGRVAPNTLFSLGLAGLALLVLSGGARPRVRSLLASLLGSLVVAVSLAALVGHLTGIDSAGWAGMKPMTSQAAAGLFVLGLAVLGLAWWRETAGQASAPAWTPVPVTLVLVAVTLLLWNALRQPGQLHVALPAMTLALGTGMALLSGLALWLAQASRLRSRQIETAKHEVQRSEERYRALVAASQVVWTTDAQGEVEDIPGWRSFTGQSREQVRGWGWAEALHPDDREKTAARWADAVKKHELFEAEYRIRRQDGEYRYFAARGAPVLEPDGSIREWVGSCIDITERKKAEEELRKASRYARSLIEASLDPLVTISKEGKITDVNQATEQVTGLPRPKLIGSDFCDYFTQQAEARQGYQKVFAEGRVRDYALAIRGQSGQVTDVLYNATVFKNEAGEIEGVFAAARDITERKRAEEEIRRMNAELEDRVAARTAELATTVKDLEAFTYSVSHDLRAPLRQINGFAKLLAEEFGSSLEAKAQEYLRWVQDGTRRMGQLVDDLLNLSRVGRRELHPQTAGMASLVREVLTDLESELKGRQIEWQVGDLPFLECDASLMKQVWANLLSNAVKFTRMRKPARIQVGQEEREGRKVLFVRDNGVGFSMKYADKLFGVFQRLHREEDFEGTGVGLATVQRIIQKHGGQIWAEAELDQGASFYFTLGETAVVHQPNGCPAKEAAPEEANVA